MRGARRRGGGAGDDGGGPGGLHVSPWCPHCHCTCDQTADQTTSEPGEGGVITVIISKHNHKPTTSKLALRHSHPQSLSYAYPGLGTDIERQPPSKSALPCPVQGHRVFNGHRDTVTLQVCSPLSCTYPGLDTGCSMDIETQSLSKSALPCPVHTQAWGQGVQWT